MIDPASKYKIYLATKPVDFRKGMDGLANYVAQNFDLDPFSGAFFVFRSKGRDKIKVLIGVVAEVVFETSFPLPPKPQATRSISAWPRELKRFMRAMRM
jgi:hypothetical protein